MGFSFVVKAKETKYVAYIIYVDFFWIVYQLIYNFLYHPLDLKAIGVVRLELVEAKDLKSVNSFMAGGKVSIL